MKKHKRTTKIHISAALRLAVRFALLIASIILMLSIVLVMLLRINVRLRQDHELYSAMDRIASVAGRTMVYRPMGPLLPQKSDQHPIGADKLGHSPRFPDLPYYIMFTVYEAGSDRIIETNDPFLPQLPLTDGHTTRFTQKDFFTDGDLNILYCAKQYGTHIPGAVVVQTALNMDQDTSEKLLSGLPVTLLLALFPLLLISFAVTLLVTKRTLRPVEQMTKAAQKIGSDNLDQLLPLSGRGDELDMLAVTFNELFARLKIDFDRERRFTADVSHELKTPLSVILGHANLIRRWGKDDPVQLGRSLDLLIGEVHSMESIITNLLQISRLESGRVRVDLQNVFLEPLCRRLEEDTAAWADGVGFDIHIPSRCTVLADRELLYQVCTIIVSNSVKFSGKDVKIEITAVQKLSDGLVNITIADNGPGILPEILPHIFDRFYRGDASHNRKAGGAGLGLSIVSSIMKVMHGSVSARSEAGKGTELVLELPGRR